MPSPVATPVPIMAAPVDAELPPLSIVELSDNVDASLEIPPTPATPDHLRRGEPQDCGDATVHQAELLSPRAHDGRPSLRMRIRRLPLNTAPASPDQEDDIESSA
ncbi:hypothetical protein QAD02_015948 [Eretmocerus hayati]|uniref:Uncharacterized protein n=1 Tax=Eretmocerus hayati TaxID=131215 RepID=A0ACC2PAZ8_9HYME|nr:hypothetical protein QAD02_015948 [Eretmocerus hayati]